MIKTDCTTFSIYARKIHPEASINLLILFFFLRKIHMRIRVCRLADTYPTSKKKKENNEKIEIHMCGYCAVENDRYPMHARKE